MIGWTRDWEWYERVQPQHGLVGAVLLAAQIVTGVVNFRFDRFDSSEADFIPAMFTLRFKH